LVGDDEHGWTDDGIFNLEGGCYAKCIRLSQENEPQIRDALRFGAVLEKVVVDPATRVPDYYSDHYTENTRAGYPVEFIPDAVLSGRGGHPTVILFLAADAFGVLPPLSRLDREQAAFHFLTGYTSKLAGTERGITVPEATFSSCFGAPFLPLPPRVYADLLAERIERHNVEVYLVNTGWSGGPYVVGSRISLPLTRTLVRAAVNGKLSGVPFQREPFFGLAVPDTCPGVPREILHPRETWADKEAYDRTARELAGRFEENFKKFA
jgi:phosphoenolpyruvate carboxykinase (ATP)